MPSPLLNRYLGNQLDGRYRLDRLIGEGASGLVFAAQDLRLDRRVAVKLFKARGLDGPSQSMRDFVAEGRLLAQLIHPHIVAVYDAGEDADGFGYLVMELSDAGSLEHELCQRGTLELAEVVHLLLPLAGALACAHDRAIVHRDVKPGNILLAPEGGARQAKLLDFGIATRGESSTSSNRLAGTPAYMAPEQAGGGAISPSTDVWGLGAVFFRCLTGAVPFPSTNSADATKALLERRAPRFGETGGSVGPSLAIALDRALEPDPRRRYEDMRSFARAIVAGCVQDGVDLPPSPDPVGLPHFQRWIDEAQVMITTQPVSRAGATGRPQRRLPQEARKSRLPVQVGLVLLGAAVASAALTFATHPGGPPSALATSARDVVGEQSVPSGALTQQTLPEPMVMTSAPPQASEVPTKPLRTRRRKLATQITNAPADAGLATPASSSEADASVHPWLVKTWRWEP